MKFSTGYGIKHWYRLVGTMNPVAVIVFVVTGTSGTESKN
jgi:hypothetical protein